MFLAVTCHLHFWQNDRDFLRATVVTRGWNGYRNKSQHRKSTLEKKILPPFQQGFEPATFQSRVRRSNYWAIPAPDFTSSSTLQNLYLSSQRAKATTALCSGSCRNTPRSVAANTLSPNKLQPCPSKGSAQVMSITTRPVMRHIYFLHLMSGEGKKGTRDKLECHRLQTPFTVLTEISMCLDRRCNVLWLCPGSWPDVLTTCFTKHTSL